MNSKKKFSPRRGCLEKANFHIYSINIWRKQRFFSTLITNCLVAVDMENP